MPCKTPVAFVVFRRPDLTQEVFRAIREARPERLFSGLKEMARDEKSLQTLLRFIEMTEAERSVMGASGHIMAIGRK